MHTLILKLGEINGSKKDGHKVIKKLIIKWYTEKENSKDFKEVLQDVKCYKV